VTDKTLDYYEQNAVELSRRYESTALEALHALLRQTFSPGDRLLEIGCGSGRDAATAMAAGFDVCALDGSSSLLQEAIRLHPELAGRLHHLKLPGPLPFANASFAGIFSVACLMHFNANELPGIIAEIARVLKPAGKALISVPAGRSDIDANGLDEHGRIFNLMPATSWQKLFAAHGFSTSTGAEEPDSLGRPGIAWVTFVLQKT